MRRCALVLTVLATILTASVVDAHPAAQTGTPAVPSAPEEMVQVPLDDLDPDRTVVAGIVRATLPPGGELSLAAGAGPTVVFVESGSIVVTQEGAEPAARVVRSGQSGAGQRNADVVAGDALILSANGSATLTNNGDAPATTLTLLSSEDAQATPGSGTAEATLVRLVTVPPPPPLMLTLSQTTLEPGDQFVLPAAPIVTVLATVERGQAFSLSGDEVNRGKEPIGLYILTLAPAMAPAESATPAISGSGRLR